MYINTYTRCLCPVWSSSPKHLLTSQLLLRFVWPKYSGQAKRSGCSRDREMNSSKRHWPQCLQCSTRGVGALWHSYAAQSFCLVPVQMDSWLQTYESLSQYLGCDLKNDVSCSGSLILDYCTVSWFEWLVLSLGVLPLQPAANVTGYLELSNSIFWEL